MKVRHIFEDQIYHISNYSVAGQELFLDEEDKAFFISKMTYYLHPVCEIIEYGIYNDQYRIILKLKDKLSLHSFFRSKKKDFKTPDFYIPYVSYLFSQQMANFQISYVKYFNHRYKRKGGLFRQRFERLFIRSENELGGYIRGIRMMEKYNQQHWMWEVKPELPQEAICEYVLTGVVDGGLGGTHLKDAFQHLRSQIPKPYKIDLIPPFHRKIISIHHQKFKFGPNLN